MRRIWLLTVMTTSMVLALALPSAGAPGGSVGELTKVSGDSPFQPGANRECSLDDAYRDGESESAIAVDPRDQNRIAVAWKQDNSLGIIVASTRDGGATWDRAIVDGLTTCTGSPGMNRVDHPRLSFAPDGALYLAVMPVGEWMPDPRNIVVDVVVVRSDDGGMTWSPPSSVTGSEILNDFDGMAIEPDTGAVDVIWTENEAADSMTVGEPIYLSRSTDEGHTWDKKLVRRAAPGSFAFTKVAPLPGGDLVVFSQEIPLPNFIPLPTFPSKGGPHGPIWVLASDTKGETWSEPVKLVDDAVNEWPNVAVTRKGTLYLSYRTRSADGGFTVWLRRSDDGAATWTEPMEAFSYKYSRGIYPFTGLAVTGEQTVGVLHYRTVAEPAGATFLEDNSEHQAHVAVSPDCGRTWTSMPIGSPFIHTGVTDLGFSQGLAPVQEGFVASVSLGGEEGTVGPTDIFAAPVDWAGVRASSCKDSSPGRG